MAARTITLLREGYSDRDGLDIAVSHALFAEAASGSTPETFRIHTPGRVVAFGKHDVLSDGYPEAVAAARAAGFSPEERLAGGRAAVFHEGTLSFSWTIPEPDAIPGVQSRFELISGLIVRAFARLGVDSAIGEVAGEYCPGRYSVHHRGRIKLMGVGQRLRRGAVHIGGVVVVRDSALVNEVLTPVYTSLGIAFDPDVTGALEDIDQAIAPQDAAGAIIAELARMGELAPGALTEETLARAEALRGDHVATGASGGSGTGSPGPTLPV